MDHLHMQKCYCNKRRIPRFSPPSSVAYYISVQGVNLGQCVSKLDLEKNEIWNHEIEARIDVTTPDDILQSLSHAVHKYGFAFMLQKKIEVRKNIGHAIFFQ